MTSSQQTIAFFGATGGCVAQTLALGLKGGNKSVALARNPSKLTDLLLKDYSVSQSTIDANLKIIKGAVQDPEAVKATLSHNASLIISGIGGAPVMQLSIIRPFTLDQPTICEDTTKAILSALRELQAEGKLATRPHLAVISTTGLSKLQRDVPLAFYPFYVWALAVPHEDKYRMEELIASASNEGPDSPLAAFTAVRASLLTSGATLGLDKVRVGWEQHPKAPLEGAPGPALGYTISRGDVGNWVYKSLIEGDADKWARKCVTITY